MRNSWNVWSRLKRFAITVLILLVVAACLVFVLENQQSVVVSFLGFSSLQLQLSFVGVAAFLFGMIVGGLIAAVYVLRAGRRERQVAH